MKLDRKYALEFEYNLDTNNELNDQVRKVQVQHGRSEFPLQGELFDFATLGEDLHRSIENFLTAELEADGDE